MPLLILTALSILACFWVFKDATTRGLHAKLWALAILLSSGLALPLYLLLRAPNPAR